MAVLSKSIKSRLDIGGRAGGYHKMMKKLGFFEHHIREPYT